LDRDYYASFTEGCGQLVHIFRGDFGEDLASSRRYVCAEDVYGCLSL
jgi:hypothetical protein